MEEEDINKFLYGEEEEPEIVGEQKIDAINSAVNEEEKTTITENNAMNIEEEEEEEEDEFEIVVEGDSNKRGLTNISLSQPTGSSITNLNVPGSNQVTSLSGSIGTLDLNGIGSITGQSIFELDLDDETGPAGDKPWRKPGADITDYFNYGFNEVTWRMYCLRQRVLREEYGNSKSNNIPPALANNPIILQGLFPKGTLLTLMGLGVPTQITQQQPSHQYHHHNYQQQQQYQQHQQQSTRDNNYQQQQQPQQYQRDSYEQRRRSSRSRSRSRTRTSGDRGVDRGLERGTDRGMDRSRPSRGSSGGYSRNSSSRRY